jgi:hypothetical protein
MKKLRFLIVLALLLIAVGSLPTGASAAYKFTYMSTINVQNLSGNVAIISLTYYNGNEMANPGIQNGLPTDATLQPYEFKAFTTLDVASGFKGSAVITSGQPIAAVSNLSGNNFAANASYVGSSTGSTTVTIPLLMKGNYTYDTWFSVQNAGSVDTSVAVTYSDGTPVVNATIKAGASQVFNQSTETHGDGFRKVFSASIVSTSQPIVVVVIEESPTVLFAYNGFAGGSKNPRMPLINMNNYNYTSSMQIQNQGAVDTNVTVQYTHGPAGTDCTETQTVPAGKSTTFGTYAFVLTPIAGVTTNCTKGSKFVGSAAVSVNSANQDLVVVVNQHRLPFNGEAYSGFDAASATAKLVAPLLMDRNYGWFTSLNIMNVGTDPVDIHCDLTNTTQKIDKLALAPGELLNAQQTAVAAGWVGSATCYAYTPSTTTVSPTGKIVGVVNQLAGGAKDTFMVYEAINVTP